MRWLLQHLLSCFPRKSLVAIDSSEPPDETVREDNFGNLIAEAEGPGETLKNYSCWSPLIVDPLFAFSRQRTFPTPIDYCRVSTAIDDSHADDGHTMRAARSQLEPSIAN